MSFPRYLSRQHVIAAGAEDWPAAMNDVRTAINLLSDGDAGMEPESAVALGADPRHKAYALPGWLGGQFQAAGVKCSIHSNAKRARSGATTSHTLLHDRDDGRLIGIVESGHLTRIRTAAVSAIAIQTLLRVPPQIVAICGAGEMARSHLEMVSAVFYGVRRVRLWNRTRQHLDDMVASARVRADLEIEPVDRLNDMEADAILTCTSSVEPFVTPDLVKPGRLIAQIGFHEVAFDAIAGSDAIVVDGWGAYAKTSAKSLFQMYRKGLFDASDVSADLAAIVMGGWRPPPQASIYFSSFGLNILDVAIAARVLSSAEARGIGTLLPAEEYVPHLGGPA